MISQDNPSDCCSRVWGLEGDDHATFAARLASMLRCVQARHRGWNWASEKANAWCARHEGLRHSEPEEGPEEAALDEGLSAFMQTADLFSEVL